MRLVTSLFIGVSAMQSFAQINLPRVYDCIQINKPIIVDGKDTESAWNKATWTDDFIDIEGESKDTPYYSTKVKMLWDTNNLYLFAVLEEEHLWATLTNHDDIIYLDNDFEVFIDPNSDNHDYMEIEINLFNTILDLMLIKPYRNGGPMIMDWTATGMQSAVSTFGTLNNPGDKDSMWCVEMALPLKTLGKTPVSGNYWRINFSRVQYETVVSSNKYKKIKRDSGKNLPEHNWVWSPQGLINMHYPENWGYLLFNDVNRSEPVILPNDAALRIALHKMYYAQNNYIKEHGVFDANIPNEITIDNSVYSVSIQIKSDDFEIKASNHTFTWHIQRDSKIWKSEN